MAAQIEAQRQQIESSAAESAALKKQLHAAAVDRLGVLPQYRSTVPDFDVTTEDGKQQLDAWAASRPEICAALPVPNAPTVKAADALKGLKSPHLVNAEWYRAALGEA